MAIVETGAIFKGFTFDGESSKDYGVYISGSGVFNAPERDVEMIAIPGRDGALALDNGRFSNITITYPAGFFGETEADFAQAASDLRNWLTSRRGYVRLEDDYNPDEYRLAVYKSGLEITPADLKSGQCSIVFECKPQRFLKSGETAISVSSGNTITNPTNFESRPLLDFINTGAINIGGESIRVESWERGEVSIMDPYVSPYGNARRSYDFYIDASPFNAGDEITFTPGPFSIIFTIMTEAAAGREYLPDPSVFSNTGFLDEFTAGVTFEGVGNRAYFRAATKTPLTFDIGTDQTYSASIGWRVPWKDNGVSNYINHVIPYEVAYRAADNRIRIQANVPFISGMYWNPEGMLELGRLVGMSTMTVQGAHVFLDLDLGEAYIMDNGIPVSVNRMVSLPAQLPTLKPGANVITFANTISQMKITPRWWQV